MTAPIAGRRILVIGGETTVGRAVAVGLAEGGAEVAIATLTATTEAEFAVNSALNELWALDRRGLALAIDASDPKQVRDAVERAERELGQLDLAAVVAPDDVAVAVDALREALERPVVVIAADAGPDVALRAVAEQL